MRGPASSINRQTCIQHLLGDQATHDPGSGDHDVCSRFADHVHTSFRSETDERRRLLPRIQVVRSRPSCDPAMRYSMIWKCRGLLHAGRAALNVSLQAAAKTLIARDKTLGLAIPPRLLGRDEEVIE
jgi:hypothetical protein